MLSNSNLNIEIAKVSSINSLLALCLHVSSGDFENPFQIQ